MAKLSARGRTEVYRVKQRREWPNGREYVARLALMSDGSILYNYGWGWKRYGKLEIGGRPEDWLDAYKKNGWQEVTR